MGRNRQAARRHRPVVATLMVLAAVATVLVASSPPGAAQSEFVTASVRTNPALPQPGDDVSVSVRITGCPPGDTDVELLLVEDLQGGVLGALMADAPAHTSLLWRTKARLELHDAVQGWYGVRIQCGNYRPLQVPMPNTTFAVGANPSAAASLTARAIPLGGTVGIHGDGCRGRSVDYELLDRTHNGDAFVATGSIPTQADGTWSAQLTVGNPFNPGPILIRARCVQVNQLGTTVYVSYGRPLDLRIEPPS